MVEQIKISPEEVRGYGNVCEEHSLDDFIVSSSGLAKEKEDVHGALTSVYMLVYSVYGLMFYFDKGAKQLYLQTNEADTLSLGFDTENKQLYLVDENDTGFSLDFDEDTNELYITDDVPPIVHNYTLALDSESYTTTGSLSVSATLLDDGVAVSGATVSFTGGTSTVTATTDSSGVATATVNFTSSGTLTATYSNVSDTATVTVSSTIYESDFSQSSSINDWIDYFSASATTLELNNSKLRLYSSASSNQTGFHNPVYLNKYLSGDYKITFTNSNSSYPCFWVGFDPTDTNKKFVIFTPNNDYGTAKFTNNSSNPWTDTTSNRCSWGTNITCVIECVSNVVNIYVNNSLKGTIDLSQLGGTDGYFAFSSCCSRNIYLNTVKVEAL